MSITVICPNARRVAVKVAPNDQLRQVLEEACLRSGFDVDQYELKYHGKALDTSLPIRLTGLPNNVTLDLSFTESSQTCNVDIALQFSDGTRKIRNILNTSTLSEMLQAFSSDFGCDLLSLQETGKTPCLSYTNKQWKGSPVLSSTTLKAMGITSGKVLLRYDIVSISEKEIQEATESLAKERERQQKMAKIYEKEKAENAARQQMEEEYAKAFEERQRELLEERQREEAMQMEKQAENFSAVSITSSSAGTSSGATTSATTSSATASSNTATIGSVSSPTTSSSTSRLTKLQSILSTLNTSIESGTVDNLADALVSEEGRIQVDVAMEDLSAGTAPVANDVVESYQMDFSNFKFPETPIATAESVMRDNDENLLFSKKAERHAVVFCRSRPSSAANGEEDEEVDDSFFELTTSDAKKLQHDLREQVRVQAQRAFLPAAFIKRKNKELKTQSYRHTVIRFVFGENVIVQAQFYSLEPGCNLFDFVKSILRNNSLKFILNLLPNEKIEETNAKDLIDLEIAPKSTVIVKTSTATELASLLNESLLTNSTEEEANMLCKEWLSPNSVFRPYNPTVVEDNQNSVAKRVAERMLDGPADRSPSNAAGSTPQAPLPKWLKR